MRFHLLFLVGTVAALGCVEACGGDTTDGGADSGGPDTTTTDVTPPIDTGTDTTTTTDAPDDTTTVTDTGTTDGGGTDASDGGAQDSGLVTLTSWQCGSVTVSDCTQCTGYTQPCVYCATGFQDAAAYTGVCVITHSNCLNAIPNGYQDCPCNNDASTCVESYQICNNQNRCHTCEDNNNNTGLTCQNGGTCNATDGGCL
jgi:hypothetical protein